MVANLPTIGPDINALILTIMITLVVTQALKISYSIPMRLPFRANDNFTGRDRELAEIHRVLQSANHDATISCQRVMVLHGLGGIGKTQLAIQYAHIHQKDYTSIWWVDASTTQTLSEGFLGIAQQLLSYHAKIATAEPFPGVFGFLCLASADRLRAFVGPYFLINYVLRYVFNTSRKRVDVSGLCASETTVSQENINLRSTTYLPYLV